MNSRAGWVAQRELNGESFRRLFKVLRLGWWIVAICGLGLGAIVCMVGLTRTPIYASSVTLYVTSGFDSNAQSAYQGSLASQQRVASYARLVSSDAVVESALEAAKLNISVEDVKDSVSATTTPETVLLTITAEDPRPDVAAVLANAIANSMARYVSILETPSSGVEQLAKLTVVSSAEFPSEPIKPQILRDTAIGFAIGCLVGVLIILAKDRLDTRVRSSADLEEVVGKSPLTSIPNDRNLGHQELIDFRKGATSATEAYRKLRTSLSFVSVDAPARKILVTSSSASEGKTTVSLNLATALAESGNKVVVVDADLRRPAIAHRLPVDGGVGFTDSLAGDVSVTDLVQPSGIDGLDVLASGSLPPNPSELLESRRARRALDELSNAYDYVIVDSPPILPVTDAAVIAAFTDGVVVVVRSGRTKRQEVVATVDQLSAGRVTLLGFVLNDVAEQNAIYEYAGYGHENSTEVQGDLVRD